jgi:hypothetical protein
VIALAVTFFASHLVRTISVIAAAISRLVTLTWISCRNSSQVVTDVSRFRSDAAHGGAQTTLLLTGSWNGRSRGSSSGSFAQASSR